MAMVSCLGYGQNSRCSTVTELVTGGEILDALSVLAENNAEYLAEILEGHDAASCHWQQQNPSPAEGCMGAGGGGGGALGNGCMGLPSPSSSSSTSSLLLLPPPALHHNQWHDPLHVSADLSGADMMFYPRRGDEGGDTTPSPSTTTSPGYDTINVSLSDFPTTTNSLSDFGSTHNNHMNTNQDAPAAAPTTDLAYSGFGTGTCYQQTVEGREINSRTHQATDAGDFSPTYDMSSASSQDGQQSDSELMSPRPPVDRRLRRREQNRQAARRCRQRKKEQSQELVKDYYHLLSANSELQSKLQLLESEKRRLEEIYEAHLSTCAMQFSTSE